MPKDLLRKMESSLKDQGLIASRRTSSDLFQLIYSLDEDALNTGKYVRFDAECIYDRSDYEDILLGFKNKCGDKNHFHIVSVTFDVNARIAGICIVVNGHEFKRDWSQQDDWVSAEFFETVDQFNKVLRGKFVKFWIDQDFRAVYIEDESIAAELSILFDELITRFVKEK